MTEQKKPVLTAQEVMEIIPNRWPMIFVDRVDELIPGKRVVATKNVTISEPYFKGHFPGNPIMPGVLQLEAMAQVGSIPLLMSDDFQNKIAFLVGSDNVRWRQNVVPGDVLTITVDIIKLRKRMGTAQAVVTRADGAVVSEAKLMFAISDLVAN